MRAMEIGIVFNPSDYEAYAHRRKACGPAPPAVYLDHPGYEYSGSSAGRNIEVIYELAEDAGITLSLEDAVRACFDPPNTVRHVLVCSGFFVLHGRHGTEGSAETDGPLGALALLRAFAVRGVRVSLFCDERTGPVMKAAYDYQLEYLRDIDAELADCLARNTRCLPVVAARPSQEDGDPSAITDIFAKLSATRLPPGPALSRSVSTASQLGAALRDAWAGHESGQVDCLFAIERLGQPYKNIRGRDISESTDPVDSLWPLAPGGASSATEEAVKADLCGALRLLAGIRSDALSLGIGDGGNEVGMGKVALAPAIADLSPGGEFAPLSVNGCVRSCDHLLLGTVSNWAGTAFEMAAHVLCPVAAGAPDVSRALQRRGLRVSDLEEAVLLRIMCAPPGSVDGKYPEREFSVDGMPFNPYHRGLYDLLWRLADLE